MSTKPSLAMAVMLKTIFLAHRDSCEQCKKVLLDDSGTLQHLCYRGLMFWKEMAQATPRRPVDNPTKVV